MEEENCLLKKRIAELEEEVEDLKKKLEKYKESSRFQLQQLKEYNDSLKEQLQNAKENVVENDDSEGEYAEETTEIFNSLVFNPSNEVSKLQERCSIENSHSSNVLSVIPWQKNESYIFSSDVTKHVSCIFWDQDGTSSSVSEAAVSAPCCSLVTACNDSLLLAGCMDGYIHVFQIDNANRMVKGIKKIKEIKLHEKAIVKMRWSEELQMLLVTSYDNTVSLCTVLETGEITVKSKYYFKYSCDAVAFAPKHRSILIAERNQPFMNYINIDNGEKTEVAINNHSWDLHVSFCITDVTFMHEEEFVLALTDKGNVIVYKFGENTHVKVVYGGSMLSDSYYNSCLAVDDREKYVFVISVDNAIHVFSLYTGKEVYSLEGHTKTIRNMFYLNGLKSLLFTCSYDHSIKVWY